jgi:hypothetical protein
MILRPHCAGHALHALSIHLRPEFETAAESRFRHPRIGRSIHAQRGAVVAVLDKAAQNTVVPELTVEPPFLNAQALCQIDVDHPISRCCWSELKSQATYWHE